VLGSGYVKRTILVSDERAYAEAGYDSNRGWVRSRGTTAARAAGRGRARPGGAV